MPHEWFIVHHYILAWLINSCFFLLQFLSWSIRLGVQISFGVIMIADLRYHDHFMIRSVFSLCPIVVGCDQGDEHLS